MQFAVKTRQLARIFVDAQSVTIGGDHLAEITNTAKLAERMNTTIVLQVPMLDTSLPEAAPRIALASTRLDWQLALLGQSFDLTRLPCDATGSNIGEFEQFAEAAAEILWECSRVFGRPAYRLALAQSGLLAEMTDEKLEAVQRRLMHWPPNFGGSGAPFEWDWRVASHGVISLGTEATQTNLIATIKRQAGTVHLATEKLPFDRISVELDVNTTLTDARGRFGKEELRQFFLMAAQEHTRLATALTAFAFEEQQ